MALIVAIPPTAPTTIPATAPPDNFDLSFRGEGVMEGVAEGVALGDVDFTQKSLTRLLSLSTATVSAAFASVFTGQTKNLLASWLTIM